jgi:hypothetical protein
MKTIVMHFPIPAPTAINPPSPPVNGGFVPHTKEIVPGSAQHTEITSNGPLAGGQKGKPPAGIPGIS